MAAPRAYWKGYLKLSLVTCPVALYPASSQSEKTRFHQINRKTGNRLRQQMVDEKTGRVVEGENKGRGYELKRGSYVEIDPEEIEAVEVESTRAIDIDKFVPEDEIDKRYYERPYYIAPDDKSGEEAFAVIRDAMKDKGRVALARIVFANREHILAIDLRPFILRMSGACEGTFLCQRPLFRMTIQQDPRPVVVRAVALCRCRCGDRGICFGLASKRPHLSMEMLK